MESVKYFSSFISFVRSLSDIKNAQSKWAQKSLDERLPVLNKAFERSPELHASVKSDVMAVESVSEQFFQLQYVRWADLYFKRLLLEYSESLELQSLAQPTGLFLFDCQDSGYYRLMLERILPCVFAGNGVVVVAKANTVAITKKFISFLQDSGIDPDLVTIVHLNENEIDMAFAHPGFKGLMAVTNEPEGHKKLEYGLRTYKKQSVLFSAKNSAVVLGDSNLQIAAEGVYSAAFEGSGLLPWSISRVFVLESMEAEFKAHLAQVNKMSIAKLNLAEGLNGAKVYSEILSEKAQCLFGDGNSQPTAFFNLHNCSPYQQDAVAGPFLIINTVKYPHEFAKWINTSYLGVGAQIWGSEQKILNIQAKLEVPHIWKNSWIEGQGPATIGFKSSYYGCRDLKMFGQFFSDVKSL
jgi:acyl-CoA reductase-like NAD-dependent aldehyde dehydrogenase